MSFTVAVRAPVHMKQATASMDRMEKRGIPQTPWPLVHPFPSLVPKPTKNPAKIDPIQPILANFSGWSKAFDAPDRIGLSNLILDEIGVPVKFEHNARS